MHHRTSHFAGILTAAALLAACATAPKVNLQTEEQAIRDLDRRWVEAMQAKDVNTVVGFYAPDAYAAMPNMPGMVGHAALRSAFAEMVKMPNLAISATPTRITVAKSGELATDVGTFRFAYDGPNGRVEDEGSYSTVWRKIDGQWKVTSDLSVSAKPLPQPPPPMVVVVEGETHEMSMGGALKWQPLTKPGLAPGAMMTVVHGDPGKAGGDYTMRLRFPDGYAVPPHWHPKSEHVTILQGSLSLGTGERADRAATRPYSPGDFFYMPAKAPHYVFAKGETVVQLHGEGPFELNLVAQ